MAMASAGWKMQAVTSRKHVLTVKSSPYKHNEGEKIWYMHGRNMSLSRLSSFYLEALLAAEALGTPVPHFASNNVYKKLLDPEFEPPAKRQRTRFTSSAMDDWELLAAMPKRRSRKARKTLETIIDEPEHDFDPIAPDAELASSSSESNSASTCTSDTSSSSVTSAEPETSMDRSAQLTQPELATDAKRADMLAVDACATDADTHRRPKRGIEFGCCFLTMRYKAGVASGCQITCAHPGHNRDKRCTKE
eukprot:5965439-Amphidinium_carterae.1